MNAQELIDLVEKSFNRRYWGFLEDFCEYYEGDTFSEKIPEYCDFTSDGEVDLSLIHI